MNRKTKKRFQIIDSINYWVGSWLFLIIHIIWFFVWWVGNYNMELLILVVSLEAIILMILLLMAQNWKSIKDDCREEKDLKVDLTSMHLLKGINKHIKQIESDIKQLKK